MIERHENLANGKPLSDDDGEVRELAADDFARMVPFSGLPKEHQELLSQPKTTRPEPDEERPPPGRLISNDSHARFEPNYN